MNVAMTESLEKEDPLHNGRTSAATRHSHCGSIYGVGRRFQSCRINNLELVDQSRGSCRNQLKSWLGVIETLRRAG